MKPLLSWGLSPLLFDYKLLEQTDDVNSDNLERSRHSCRGLQERTLPLQRPGSGSPQTGYPWRSFPSGPRGLSSRGLSPRGLSPRVVFIGNSCFSLDFLTQRLSLLSSP